MVRTISGAFIVRGWGGYSHGKLILVNITLASDSYDLAMVQRKSNPILTGSQ